MITVCCFLWSDSLAKHRHIYTYEPQHVQLLQRMVARHLSLEHEFVCVTDRKRIGDGIRTVPLDMKTFIPGTRYAKLMLFHPDAAAFIGKRILYLDLDCVVTNSLDPIVSRSEDLVLFRNPNFGIPKRAFYNTSIILLRAGSRPEVWRRFDPRSSPAMLKQRWGGTDQAWISHMASRNEAHWTADDGVYGAGRLGDYNPGIATTKLPDNARIVFFPGRRVPWLPTEMKKHPWIEEYMR